MTDYYALGKAFEEKGDYETSYSYYEKYALTSEVEGTHSILLRLLLLKGNFTYSDELEKELLRSYGEYNLGLRNERLYEAIAEYIVFKHENKTDKSEEKRKEIISIYKYGKFPVLDPFIKKDNIKNSLNIPIKTIEFINSL